jgi:heme exporter protein D
MELPHCNRYNFILLLFFVPPYFCRYVVLAVGPTIISLVQIAIANILGVSEMLATIKPTSKYAAMSGHPARPESVLRIW